MDNSHKDFNSSIPNFTFKGNKENEMIEEKDFKLKNYNKKRIPKRNMFAKRKKPEPPRISKSVSVNSLASRFSIVETQDDVENGLNYHPVTNLTSPRPKYLMFSPDRHREILARQEKMDRIVKCASYDCVMNLSDEGTDVVTDRLVDNVNKKEDVFGEVDKGEEFEDEKGWSLKMLVKWLVVMIVVMLMTLTISSGNLPTPLPVGEVIRGWNLTVSSVDWPMPSYVRGVIRGCMDLYRKSHSGAGLKFGEVFKAITVRNYEYEKWDEKDLVVNGDGLGEIRSEQIEDVCEDEVESKDELLEKVDNEEINVGPDGIWNKKDSGKFQEAKPDEIKHAEVEENEIEVEHEDYSQLLGIDSILIDASEDVVGKEDDKDDGLNEYEIEGVKTIKFDPVSSAFIGISLLIVASSSVLYYAMQTKIPSIVGTTKNDSANESSSITSFGTTGSVLTDYDQSTGDSHSHGSFTIEKMIVKKQKYKTPEAMLSKVRRSSRIHKRSITPSP